MILQNLFNRQGSRRDNFNARLLGTFSEDIVRCWCSHPNAQYKFLGRPTLKKRNDSRGWTLDFLFCDQQDRRYVGELKCWPAFERGKFLVLRKVEQFKYLEETSQAFGHFLKMAENPSEYGVTIPGDKKPQPVSGCILVWAAFTDEGRNAVMQKFCMKDVLSLQKMIEQLVEWNKQEFSKLLQTRQDWCASLFNALRCEAHSTGVSGDIGG
jgi:hypothetical protein